MDTDNGVAYDIRSATKEGTRRIVEKILNDARSESQDIRTYGDNQVQEIVSSAMNEANALREEMLKKGKQEAQTEKNRILSQARLDTRKRVLEAKERQMQKVLEEAASVLGSPDTIPAYADVMRRIATEACAAIGGETLVIRTDDAGSAALKPVLDKIEKDIEAQTGAKTSLSLSSEGVNGVVVVSASGVIVDNTFATRLERRKRDIRKELAAILFG